MKMLSPDALRPFPDALLTKLEERPAESIAASNMGDARSSKFENELDRLKRAEPGGRNLSLIHI